MRKLILALLIGCAALSARPSLSEPSLSPDHSEVVFISGGDIWTVPATGGVARLLVSHPATESRPMYSPDGKKLAFVSTRTGNGDIYVLTLGSGELKRVTFDDGMDELSAWSRDGKYLYFHSTARDIGGMNDIYRVSSAGGTPMQVSADRYANEYFAVPAPNGEDLAFTARGIVSGQWWRHGHSHLDESEIYIRHGGTAPTYERLSTGQAKEAWPMWSTDGKQLFYVSDRGGAENVWARNIGGQPKQLTKFSDGRVLWPSISYDGRAIVFERDFQVWKCDPATGKAGALEISLLGVPAGPSTSHLTLTNGFGELALSPDSKKVAFIAHGEVFAASSKDGGNAVRVTQTAANESQPVWAPDNHRLAYVSDRDGAEHLYLYDFRTNTEVQLTKGNSIDCGPFWSPDGKHIAFFRDGKQLRILDLDTNQDRLIAQGFFERPPQDRDRTLAWSPDNRWIAFITPDSRYFQNVQVVGLEGGAPQKVSFLANSFSGSLVWSPDGKYLLFLSSQRTENAAVARIDLVPRTPRFREDQFRDLFKEEPAKPAAGAAPAKPSPTPTEVVTDGIRQRLTLLPVGLNPGSLRISPDGKTLLLSAQVVGQTNLYTYSLDELGREPAVARQLTSTPGFKGDAQWSTDGKEVYYIEGGRINVITVDTRQAKPVAVTADMEVGFADEKREVFRQAWSYLNSNFYDGTFGGKNWAALRDQFAPVIEGAQTPDEVRRAIGLMIGELNASHSGIAAGTPASAPYSGRLGVRFDGSEYDKSGVLKINEVIPLTPAALAGIKVGDVLLAVDGRALDASTSLDELLQYKIDRRIALTIQAGPAKREVAVLPVNTVTEKRLLYRQWVERNREYVAKASNGRLGYAHMIDMGQGSLDQLFLDLDADNHSRDGVVIDIRNNNGGFVNAYALDVLTRRGYLNMTYRGSGTAPARSILGQRALEKPTVLVVNQHSLSDAEDFTEGYRTLKLGKVVGEPTAGWIIYTSGTNLIDGSTLRLPFIKITANDGSNMEGHPRPVDVPVLRPIGESYTGHDTQLDAAVRVLLEGLR